MLRAPTYLKKVLRRGVTPYFHTHTHNNFKIHKDHRYILQHYLFLCVFLFIYFYFIKILKSALPGVLLKFDRSSYVKRKEKKSTWPCKI